MCQHRFKPYLLLLLMVIPLAISAQPHIVCQSSPSANYYVIGSPGSTFTWSTGGAGAISGQGNDSITVNWNPTLGSYTLTVFETSVDGCIGPLRTLDITVVAYATTINASICQGQTYTLPDGSSVGTAGSYPVTLTSSTGCDSVVTTVLDVTTALASTVNAQICQGQAYILPDGSSVTANGTYPVTLTSSAGCDSIVTTNLTVSSASTSTVNAQICQGQTYTLPDGSSVTAAGTYPVTLTSSIGCDSIVTTNITVNSTFATTLNAQICQGQSYTLPDGSSVTASGAYPVTLTSSSGCDSIITTNLTVLSVLASSVNAQICQGQSYTLPDGSSVTTSGTYPVTLNSSSGCDSIVTTNLTVNSSFAITVNAQICQGQSYTLPDGSNVNTSGAYPVTLTSSAGCDSIVTTNLTVLNVLTSTVNAQVCLGQTYTLPDGSNVAASGTYPVTLTSSAGCDSVVTTNLTVLNTLTSSVNAQVCQGQSYTLPDGSSVTASGSYPVTLTSSAGCDSVVTTNLTVVNVLTSSLNAQVCQGQSYTLPDGTSVTASGSYPVTLTSSAGCDSVVTTNLTVVNVLTSSVNAQICQGQSFTLPDGSSVTASGSYPVTLTSSAGCDSIVTTNLTVVNVLTSSVNAQICQGQSYTLPDGSSVSTSGAYPVTLTSSIGCDSIVTTNLTVNNSFASSVNAQVCQGQSYTLPNGTSVSASGTYPVTLISAAGCDSVVTTILTVVNVLTSSVNAQICQGQSYTLPDGSSVNVSGTYPVTLTSSGGCDSIVTTNLTVSTVLTTTVNAQICEGDTYSLPDGATVGTTGSYPVTLTSSGGCDSVVTTNLTVNQAVNRLVDVSICEGSSYFAGGANQTQSGTYLDVFTGSNGCDSLVTTNLTVTSTIRVNASAQICSGDSYTLPSGSVVTTGGTYNDTLTSSAGCDSVITTLLTVLSVSSNNVTAEICQGETYTLPDGNTVQSTGVYTVALTGANGCDSTIITNLTVKALPQPVVVDATTICIGDSFLLTIQPQPDEVVVWPDGSGGNSYIFTESGTFTLSITNECGTTNSTIEVIAEDCRTCDVFLPNAFTPNGDGINDRFTPILTCEEVVPFLFRVYNRWNELVFETDQPGVGWDGIYKGEQQPTDSYIYYVSYFNIKQGKSLIKKGVVTKLN